MSRVTHLLNKAAEVWRYSAVSDGMGGFEPQWSQIATGRARFSQPNATERVSAAESQARLTHVVYVDTDADLRRGDELRMDGRKFDVLAVFEPSMPGTYLRADCFAKQLEL